MRKYRCCKHTHTHIKKQTINLDKKQVKKRNISEKQTARLNTTLNMDHLKQGSSEKEKVEKTKTS